MVTGSEPTIRLMWSLFTSPKRPPQAEGETLPTANRVPHSTDTTAATTVPLPAGLPSTALLASHPTHLQSTTESKTTSNPHAASTTSTHPTETPRKETHNEPLPATRPAPPPSTLATDRYDASRALHPVNPTRTCNKLPGVNM